MVDVGALKRDLADEHESLDAFVASLDERGWDTPTPAEPWSVRDQIAHLAFFDDQAALAVLRPESFAESFQQIAADVGTFMDRSVTKGRSMHGSRVLGWWREARTAMLEAVAGVEPGRRIPWFGPPMSPASFISARIMETWAHGQDVADGLGRSRVSTHRLRHVAHIGVLARRYSYETNGLTSPDGPVFVELTGPGGEKWAWGEPVEERVTGPALDFCLVVTRRRNVADTDLAMNGRSARQWMGIAQAYAGPPGEGRRPGQFAKG
ncbi:MAG: TIGR03084 family metal-binding protein [Actinomycetota bacterium]